MKKLFLVLMTALFMLSCATPVVNQVELYGTVEDVWQVLGEKHYRVKVWCESKEKYYKVITDKHYQLGDRIRIK